MPGESATIAGPALGDRSGRVRPGTTRFGKEAYVGLGLLVGHAAEAELGRQVIETGQAMELGAPLQAVVRRADDLDLDGELGA